MELLVLLTPRKGAPLETGPTEKKAEGRNIKDGALGLIYLTSSVSFCLSQHGQNLPRHTTETKSYR